MLVNGNKKISLVGWLVGACDEGIVQHEPIAAQGLWGDAGPLIEHAPPSGTG